ncbi:glycoside hydrolase family 2 protein [Arachidicoccus terrestris]|uniref:glycoside hydrolase family 2 protein n=1 Tax=Arachidicoccus terrestris TaxID=2875539 RepID=UPI001CC76A99|nr:glycoside hydrolase family 2 TIM barrel-domain containing protein [Arachidicoccus terrestris]UAY55524.1 DUF4982 domain-containing protein [Arachidicoccus terrestris]
MNHLTCSIYLQRQPFGRKQKKGNCLTCLSLLLMALLMIIADAPAQAQLVMEPLQKFNTGWEFTALAFTHADGQKTGVKRGLGKDWSDQFNVQVVNKEDTDYKDSSTNFDQERARLKAAKWQKVILPHTAFIEPVPIETPTEGYAYYRKTFTVPSKLKGKIIQLAFDGVMQIADVWINGRFVKRHQGGYLPFTLDLTDRLNYGKKNTIFIKVDNRASPLIPPGKPVTKLDFIYYSGIYRDTWLHITDPLHITIATAIHTTGGGGVFIHYEGLERAGEHRGRIKIRTNIQNQDRRARTFRIVQRLVDQKGRQAGRWQTPMQQLPAGTDSTFVQNVLVEHPHLWSLEDPYRYTLVTSIMQNGVTIHQVRTRIGLRTIRITKEKGLLINDQPVRLMGSNRHMNYPWIGNALSDNANIRDAVLVKRAGINALRLGHYPQDPSFYDACDSLGILLIDCIPGWQFFNKAASFKALVMRDIREMIRRDRNHPAVFLWEVSLNEAYPPKEFRVAQSAVAHREWQDSTDFYTSGDSYFTKAAWDVPYDDWNGDPGARNNTTYPDHPFLVREYGDYEFGGGESSSRKSRAAGEKALLQQAWNLQWEHNRNQVYYPRCIGDMTWAFFDGMAGLTNIVEYWGMADLYRIPKFSYYFFQSQKRKPNPMVYIANYWEKGPNNKRKVIVYSNGDSVRLSVNGRQIATQGPDRGPDRPYGTDLEKGGHPFTGGDASHLASPPFTFRAVPFQAGELKAEGIQRGKVVAISNVYTPGKPVRIQLSVADQGVPLQADGADAVFIHATLMDAAGHPVFSADSASSRLIQFSVHGSARIVSPELSATQAGIATILLQSTGKRGEIEIEATAEGLKGDCIKFPLN